MKKCRFCRSQDSLREVGTNYVLCDRCWDIVTTICAIVITEREPASSAPTASFNPVVRALSILYERYFSQRANEHQEELEALMQAYDDWLD